MLKIKFVKEDEFTMKVYVWDGLGDYTHLLVMNKEDFLNTHIQKLSEELKFLNRDDTYYLFANINRKVIANPPCLAFIMGGQYNESSPIKNAEDLNINFNEYKIEEFAY